MYLGLTVSEWLTIAAIVLAPILAVQVQKLLERWREKKERKSYIFRSLMATRAARVSGEHVAALNMIDIEFCEKRILWFTYSRKADKQVMTAWREYRDQLNSAFTQETISTWSQRGEDLFIDLLHALSQALGYDLDRVQLRRGAYSPKAHGQWELTESSTRENLALVLSGEKAIPVEIRAATTGSDQNQTNVEQIEDKRQHLRKE